MLSWKKVKLPKSKKKNHDQEPQRLIQQGLRWNCAINERVLLTNLHLILVNYLIQHIANMLALWLSFPLAKPMTPIKFGNDLAGTVNMPFSHLVFSAIAKVSYTIQYLLPPGFIVVVPFGQAHDTNKVWKWPSLHCKYFIFFHTFFCNSKRLHTWYRTCWHLLFHKPSAILKEMWLCHIDTLQEIPHLGFCVVYINYLFLIWSAKCNKHM